MVWMRAGHSVVPVLVDDEVQLPALGQANADCVYPSYLHWQFSLTTTLRFC